MRRKGLGEAPPASRRFFPDVSRLAPGPRSLLLPTVLGEHSTVAGPGLSPMRAPLRLDDRPHLQPRPPLHRLPVATAGLHASLVVLSVRRPLAGRHSDVQVP